MTYQTVPLRDVLRHRKGSILIDDLVEYKLCRVQLHRKGVVLRQVQKGSEIRTKKQQVCRTGDFIVAEMDAKVGGYGFIPSDLDGAIVSSHYYLFEVNEDRLLPEYLYVLTQTDYIQSQIKATGSTNYASIRPSEVLELKIPLRSLEQQQDIVNQYKAAKAKADTLTAELQTQKTLLTKLRQSILQEAVQGKLTERWRAERKGFEPTGPSQVAGLNPAGGSINDNEIAVNQPVTPGGTGSGPVRTATGSDETGAELLTRIRAEKAELIRQGKLRKEKPLPPITDAEKPFELPDGWVWCRLAEIANIKGGIQKTPDRIPRSNPYPYMRVANVQRGYLVLDKIEHFELSEGDLENWRLEKGDLLIVEGNGSHTEIGRCAIWKGDIQNCVHQNHLIRVRAALSEMPQYLIKYINSSFGTAVMKLKAITTTGLYTLSVGKISELPIPLPPLSEQQAIVAQVEKALAQVSELEAENRHQQAEVGRLMQAVLREAFSGKEVVEN